MKRIEFLESCAVPLAILAGGVVMLQVHAIPYWQGQFGQGWGVLGSILLEISGLYLLYRRGWLSRLTGGLIAVVLVGVPLYAVGLPHLEAWQADRQALAEARAERAAAERKAPLLRKEIASLEETLATIEANSRQRVGWYDLIERYRGELGAKRDKLAGVVETAEAPLPAVQPLWARIVDVAPVAAALVVYWLLNVVGVLAVSDYRERLRVREAETAAPLQDYPAASASVEALHPVEAGTQEAGEAVEAPRPVEAAEAKRPAEAAIQAVGDEAATPREGAATGAEPEAPAVPATGATTDPDDLLVKRLQKAIAERMRAEGLSGKQFCRLHNVNERDLAWLKRHFARKAAGEPTVSAGKLADLAGRFMGEAGTAGG